MIANMTANFSDNEYQKKAATEYFLFFTQKVINGSRKFCQRGSNFDNFFFKFDEGRWRFAGVPMMARH